MNNLNQDNGYNHEPQGYEQSMDNGYGQMNYSQDNGYGQMNYCQDNGYNKLNGNSYKRKSVLSIMSLILAILSIVCCCFFGWIPAILSIILAIIALIINVKDDRAWISIIVSILALIAAIVFGVTGDTIESMLYEAEILEESINDMELVYSNDNISVYLVNTKYDNSVYEVKMHMVVNNEEYYELDLEEARINGLETDATGYLSTGYNSSKSATFTIYNFEGNDSDNTVELIFNVIDIFSGSTIDVIKLTIE